MKWLDMLILVFSIFFSFVFQLFNYKVLSNHNNFKFTFKKYLIFILCLLFIIFINLYDVGILKPYFAFLTLLIFNKFVFEDTFNITINITLFGYIIVVITEILISIINNCFNILNFQEYSDNFILILLFSFITNFSSYLVCRYVKIFKKILNKINKFTVDNNYKIYMLILFLFILLIIDFKYVVNLSINSYIINVLLFVAISFIFLAYLNNEMKIKTELDKVDILLDNITKYEKIIDCNRISNHEILNNLILLKSFKNKNSKKYDKLLDELICLYDKDYKTIKNIGNLPKGIKGIIYYKLDDLDKNDIDICIDISNRISSIIDKLNNKDYIVLCKVLPILLDNAIYACKLSKERKLLFEIYKEENNIVFCILNSCYESVNINKIGSKYFSTKGENRGLGLFLVNKLLRESENISLVQEYKDTYFISKLILRINTNKK